ncbi:hypothetical protein VTL71DRAFT_14352 [Oculimacula yallundae]|uniref:Uncharacterized protein n=1 Tax=Oculimacula yallundae TaxID=86028 RepID=A0ABR4CID2_9HELO
MVPFLLTPLDPSTYTWQQQTPLNPTLWRRVALSNELMWPSRPKSIHELFISTALSLAFPIPRATLDAAAGRAWQTLRYHVPELALEACVADNGVAYLQYRMAQSQSEVDAWLVRTSSYFEAGGNVLSFDDLRRGALKEKEGRDSDNALLLLYSHDRDEGRGDGLVEDAQIMLNVDHQVTDGTGIKIILGKYLSLLASALNEPYGILQDEIPWEESYKNLSTPWIQLMNEDQVISGSEYEEVVTRNRLIILEKLSHNPGLPLSPTTRPPSQETHSITLTTSQTSSLLQAIKQNLSATSNITHLCHAAVVIALLQVSPPPLPTCISQTQTQTLYSPCFLNGRRYLTPAPACPSPNTDYIPICLSFAPIIFGDISELVSARTATDAEIRENLVKACRRSTEQYLKIRERKSMLPECVNLFEEIGRSALLYAYPS